MSTNSEKKPSEQNVQEHCIDLPGETVQCWIGGGTEKLKVILRKHRDVIFDININNDKNYSIESTKSDFYNVRDKKIVSKFQHGKVMFKDGERMHVWVSRDFQGELILKSDDHVIYKVQPNKLDEHQYGDNPKEKPAPIILAIGNSSSDKNTPVKKTQNSNETLLKPVLAASSPLTSDQSLSCPVVCVVDGKIEGMPADIAAYFKKGGDHSGMSDIDPNHVATKNWIWGQVAGTGAYIKDNWEWLRASLDNKTSKGFQLVKAQVKLVRGNVRFYFSGYSNSNTIFGRGGFGPSHDRIITIFAGVGKTASSFGAIAKGIAGTFKGNALVSFVFGSATAVAEWKEDVNKDGYDLAVALFMTIAKTILAAVVVTLVVAAIVWITMIAVAGTIPIILVGALTIGVGVAANYIIEAADKAIGRAITHDSSNNDGIASAITPWLRESVQATQERVYRYWNYLMIIMPADYQEIVL